KTKICELLYEDATIYLERKYKIIKENLEKPPLITSCVDCNVEVRQKHKNHIYCVDCAFIRKRKKDKIWKRNKRKLNKI
ncbi:MAG: hypothetical protein ACXAD7_16605, partial [Candidatus Kariarchaeaceae archaeon]